MRRKTVMVSGTPKSCPLITEKDIDSGALGVNVSPGVEAFSFPVG